MTARVRGSGSARAGYLGADPLDELIRLVLGDLDELVVKVPALSGDQDYGAFPDEISTECLIPATTSFEVDAPENTCRLLAAA
jgi:hypothetical protein